MDRSGRDWQLNLHDAAVVSGCVVPSADDAVDVAAGALAAALLCRSSMGQREKSQMFAQRNISVAAESSTPFRQQVQYWLLPPNNKSNRKLAQ
jgi:hypothetical protein